MQASELYLNLLLMLQLKFFQKSEAENQCEFPREVWWRNWHIFSGKRLLSLYVKQLFQGSAWCYLHHPMGMSSLWKSREPAVSQKHVTTFKIYGTAKILVQELTPHQMFNHFHCAAYTTKSFNWNNKHLRNVECVNLTCMLHSYSRQLGDQIKNQPSKYIYIYSKKWWSTTLCFFIWQCTHCI